MKKVPLICGTHLEAIRLCPLILLQRDDFITALAETEYAPADKDDALEDLIDSVKYDIRYAKNIVDFDDEKLMLIGWAG